MSYIGKNYAEDLTLEKDNRIMAPAAEKNKEPIFHVLKNYLEKPSAHALEVASGPGQHVAYFADLLPHVIWQPTDLENDYLKSISSYISKQNLSNVKQPESLDITNPHSSYDYLQPKSFDLILNVNMIHISPWETSLGLFNYAGQLLKNGGYLFLYGPFQINGVLSPESNVMFDKRLRSQDPSWGVRDTKDLEQLALKNGLECKRMVDMPSNNKCMIYQKRPED